MNYPQSREILEKIKSSQNILISCHRRPDGDSVGSVLAMSKVLNLLGVKTKLVSPDDIAEDFSFMNTVDEIEVVDFNDFDINSYDIFMALDVAHTGQIFEETSYKGGYMNIDHHDTNTNFAKMQIVDKSASSTAEILYKIFLDWNADISSDIATCLLTGIISDSGAFQYPGATSETLEIGSKLIEKGADKSEIIENLFRTKNLKLLNFWGEALLKMQKDESGFAWVAIPFGVYEKHGKPVDGKGSVTTLFARIVEGTKFGLVIVEEEKNQVRVSFRSRKDDFDVSKIALELGGGGHKRAAAARLDNTSYEEGVEKVLEAARKYSKP